MIMAVEVTLRKWGNSIGGVFPKSFLEERGLKPDEKVLVEIVRKPALMEVFGTLESKKSSQKFKDEVRKGWE